VIEHWRINERVAFGLSEAQLIGLMLFVAGASGWFYFRSRANEGAESAATS